MQVPILKAHLKGKWIGGQEWRAGNKKRSELISDYRCAPHSSGSSYKPVSVRDIRHWRLALSDQFHTGSQSFRADLVHTEIALRSMDMSSHCAGSSWG